MADRLTANTVAVEEMRSGALEGGLQGSQRHLESSFEAASRHLRMKGLGGMSQLHGLSASSA
ncbi:hypothetical protein BGCPKDLD_1978 [Methylorubrum suomiense]|uniref:Uncharacterized protein n=1 Tax=Methylorubrum suomiense TaxID=144191 RepID=A0ABQ4UTF5_9HYPH|nr:hypothetical protein BGCPKDLD_1978 [Methylorubrum suomiense]